jgi:glycine/D-amino acid oxidase-like deaminating enzyme
VILTRIQHIRTSPSTNMSVITKKYSSWWDNTSPDFAFQTQLPLFADIVIIGAGFTGISTAYWLSRLTKKAKRRGLRIVVLEEAPHPAFKSSGRMNGSIYLGSNRSAKHVSDLLGKKTAEKLFNYSRENNSSLRELIERGISCDAEFNGGLRMASTGKEVRDLDDSHEVLSSWDYHSARFDHNKSQHLMVAPNAKGSLFIPGEGLFDPFAFTNKLARMLRKHGVWLVYGAPVNYTEISEENGPQVYLTNGHILSAGKVVHTSADSAPWSRIHENIIHRREQVICTNPISADLDDMPLPLMPIELNGGLDSARTHNGSVMMTGGKAGLKKDPEVGVTNDTSYNERILKQLDSVMMTNFPVTNHMELSHTWTYIETEMEDGLPLIGEIPESHGHYVNMAHGRNKFGLAFLGARNIAERLLRIKVSNNDFGIFAPKRLTRGE